MFLVLLGAGAAFCSETEYTEVELSDGGHAWRLTPPAPKAPVIILPGLFSNPDQGKIIAELYYSMGYDVWIPWHSGHETKINGKEIIDFWNLENQKEADFLKRVAVTVDAATISQKYFENQKPILVGFCFGGLLALHYMLTHGDKIDLNSSVLIAPAIRFNDKIVNLAEKKPSLVISLLANRNVLKASEHRSRAETIAGNLTKLIREMGDALRSRPGQLAGPTYIALSNDQVVPFIEVQTFVGSILKVLPSNELKHIDLLEATEVLGIIKSHIESRRTGSCQNLFGMLERFRTRAALPSLLAMRS